MNFNYRRRSRTDWRNIIEGEWNWKFIIIRISRQKSSATFGICKVSDLDSHSLVARKFRQVYLLCRYDCVWYELLKQFFFHFILESRFCLHYTFWRWNIFQQFAWRFSEENVCSELEKKSERRELTVISEGWNCCVAIGVKIKHRTNASWRR